MSSRLPSRSRQFSQSSDASGGRRTCWVAQANRECTRTTAAGRGSSGVSCGRWPPTGQAGTPVVVGERWPCARNRVICSAQRSSTALTGKGARAVAEESSVRSRRVVGGVRRQSHLERREELRAHVRHHDLGNVPPEHLVVVDDDLVCGAEGGGEEGWSSEAAAAAGGC